MGNSTKKLGPRNFHPTIKEIPESKVKTTPAEGEQFNLSTDEKALGRLMQQMGVKVASSYFPGAPVWTAGAQRLLYGFVSYALGKHSLFKSRPLAMEQTVKAVTKAIQKSPNLTAMFMQHLDSKHS